MPGLKRLGAAVVLAAAFALPATAQAQLNLPILGPILAPPGSNGPSDPNANGAVSYGANPGRTGVATETNVVGPLRRDWTRSIPNGANQPLLAGDRVLVNASSSLLALDPGNGKTIWKANPAAGGPTPIAADSDIVVSLHPDGTVRAYALADGRLVWSAAFASGRSGSPVIADGRVYFVAGDGNLVALSTANGSVLWSRGTDFPPSTAVAVDEQRVYLVDGCGGAMAVAKATGSLAWSEGGGCTSDAPTGIVSNGRLFGAEGLTFRASDGAPLGSVGPTAAGAVDPSLAFAFGETGGLSALALDSGESVWRVGERTVESNATPPLIVGPTLYVADGDLLLGFDRETGTRLSTTRLKGSASYDGFDNLAGIAAGGGRIYVSTASGVTALRESINPKPDGIAIGASGFDLLAGKPITLVGIVGDALRAARAPVTLTVNPAVGKTERARRTPLADGAAYFGGRLNSNTRFSVKTGKGKGSASDSFRAFAYPKVRAQRVEAINRRQAVAVGSVSLARSKAIKGARMFVYIGSRKSTRYKRLASARLRAKGPKKARAKIKFKIPANVSRNDLFWVCVKDLPEHGYGRNTGTLRACGKRQVKVPRSKISTNSGPSVDLVPLTR